MFILSRLLSSILKMSEIKTVDGSISIYMILHTSQINDLSVSSELLFQRKPMCHVLD